MIATCSLQKPVHWMQLAQSLSVMEPGEIVVVNQQGIRSLHADVPVKKSHCIFEYIYFARTDSVIDGVSVYEDRKESGRFLHASVR